MRELLTNTNNKKKQLIKVKIFSFTNKELNEISNTYSNIIEKGYSENDKVDLTYIKDKIDELNLIKRLDKFKKNHLLFAYDFSVEFTNNHQKEDLDRLRGN